MMVTDKLFSKLKKIFFKKNFGKNDVQKENKIQEQIIELRVKTDADRGHVFLFHNGDEFTCEHPMWKVSCTHESVKSGVSTEIDNLQSLRCSSLIDLLRCYWEENNSYISGIKKVSPDHCSGCGVDNGCKAPQAVYLFEVEKMNEGFSKSHLASQGIKYVVNSPIVDKKRNIIGFVGVDCCREVDIEKILEDIVDVCQTSNDIGFMLSRK